MHDQEDILKSIEKHLDDLKGIVRWAIFLAVLFWWAGVNDDNPIKALGMEIDKEYAVIVAVLFYLVINLSVWDRFQRIGDLFDQLDGRNFKKGFTKLTLHSWIINPFSHFGNSTVSRINSAKGFGLLISVWWLCNSSLYALSDNYMNLIGLSLQGIFLLIGLASMRSIIRIEKGIEERLRSIDKTTYELLKSRKLERSIITFLGIALGGAIWSITQFMFDVF